VLKSWGSLRYVLYIQMTGEVVIGSYVAQVRQVEDVVRDQLDFRLWFLHLLKNIEVVPTPKRKGDVVLHSSLTKVQWY
jgi:hypothetical protein